MKRLNEQNMCTYHPTVDSVLHAVLEESAVFKGGYSVYSRFDVSRHLECYPAYLEVVISPSGEVEYAVPSHQEKLINIACNQLNVTRSELYAQCPVDFYGDFIRWLCQVTGYISVWYHGYIAETVTDAQDAKMRELRERGAYAGPWDTLHNT